MQPLLITSYPGLCCSSQRRYTGRSWSREDSSCSSHLWRTNGFNGYFPCPSKAFALWWSSIQSSQGATPNCVRTWQSISAFPETWTNYRKKEYWYCINLHISKGWWVFSKTPLRRFENWWNTSLWFFWQWGWLSDMPRWLVEAIGTPLSLLFRFLLSRYWLYNLQVWVSSMHE